MVAANLTGLISRSTRKQRMMSYVDHYWIDQQIDKKAANDELCGSLRGHMSISIDSAKKLLIIDDDPDALALLRQLLSGPDYTLTFARTGADGLAKAAELLPDLILLDGLMP